jgi:FlaA1/EpsC-like NDP-sugar epimerase
MLDKTKTVLLGNRRAVALALNAALGALAFMLAFLIRFDFQLIPTAQLKLMLIGLPIAAVLKTASAAAFGLTSGLWRYVSIKDLTRIIKAVSVSSIAFILIDVFLLTDNVPRSIYVLDYMLTIALFSGVKCSIRLFRETFRPMLAPPSGKRTLIIGAGDAGEIALRQMETHQHGVNMPVGFLDDDPGKQGMCIHGIPILGPVSAAATIVKTHAIAEVLIAISGASKSFVKTIVDDCAGHKVNFRILPAFKDLLTGAYDIDRIRPVKVEDLLGRDPIELDRTNVEQDLGGKCVLVTGAGGSIGSELARQIATFQPARLVLLDIAESPLFEIDRELTQRYPDLEIHAELVDIKHANEVEACFEQFRPERVYHAAAFKHVPLMEAHPGHAIRNNILGTRNLVRAAAACGTGHFVMISTDKAVKPSSVMGATKRVCERVVLSANGNGTHFAAVRFGNVLGSNGSVIPIFRKQIEGGGPVLVTHPKMTRYFMTIPEAVELVLQAGGMAEAGDTFVLEMGAPVKIVDLARSMIELSGMEADVDIEIKFTGLRPGEKLVEELADHGEGIEPTSVPKLNRLRMPDHRLPVAELDTAIDELEAAVIANDEAAARTLLWKLAQNGDIEPAPGNQT